jgi:two-component sensor histidine kinase
VAYGFKQLSASAGDANEGARDRDQESDPLDRLATRITQAKPCSIEAVVVALVCLGAGTALRLLSSWTSTDFLFATYFPAILAAGLLTGIPAAAGVTIASALVVRIFFAPVLHSASQMHREYVDFAMYLISAALTISFAHYCRVVLMRLHERNYTNEVLARELQHRSKNTCAVLEVIIRKSLAGDQDLATKVFGRIKAMMNANEQLTAPRPQLQTLRQLLQQAFAPYGEDRLEAIGPEILIEPETARHLILLVHELVTNAAKYGSLSQLNGRVSVKWLECDDTIAVSWTESDGPAIDLPKRLGFGSQLVSACVKALAGSVQHHFAPDGFSCSITFKVRAKR